MNTKLYFLRAGLVLGLIQSAWAQPLITQQPQNQTNLAGTTATLTVLATGAEPLSYQRRSYPSAGATFTNIRFGAEATLVLTNVQPTTRRFAAVVTGSGGLSATSSPRTTLTVLAPPSITVHPKAQLMTVGATAAFAVTATSTAPLAYQWRFNDAMLADKTNRSLALSNVQLTDAGNYSVVVANEFGSITSQVAVLMFTTVHRIGITANPDQTISLNLAGVVPSSFAAYYDLYPLEESTNLVDWSPLAMLQRTNDSSAALNYLDSDATHHERRFYRTSTNFLITPFPKPSGPYSVGTVSRLMTDPSRTNRYNIRTNSSFMVTFWYPAEAKAGVLPGAYVENNADLLKYLNARSTNTVAKFVSHALPGLQLATNETSYPVLIYSPSGATRRQNTDIALELASNGYVVVALDYAWAYASVFPDGRVVIGTQFCTDTHACFQPTLENGIKDL